jgi:MgtC family
MSAAQATFYHLGVALAIGLLIGVERGWSERDEEEGTRVAGVRTFALIGLLGGAVALAAPSFGAFFRRLGYSPWAGCSQLPAWCMLRLARTTWESRCRSGAS